MVVLAGDATHLVMEAAPSSGHERDIRALWGEVCRWIANDSVIIDDAKYLFVDKAASVLLAMELRWVAWVVFRRLAGLYWRRE
jgi:hypothetical protein